MEHALWRPIHHPAHGSVFHLLRIHVQRDIFKVDEYIRLSLVPAFRKQLKVRAFASVFSARCLAGGLFVQ